MILFSVLRRSHLAPGEGHNKGKLTYIVCLAAARFTDVYTSAPARPLEIGCMAYPFENYTGPCVAMDPA